MRLIEPIDILTMATFEIEIDDEKIHQLLRGDQGMAVLLEAILNQILQAEMTSVSELSRMSRPTIAGDTGMGRISES